MSTPQETPTLSRDAMDRLAAVQGVTINVKKRTPYAHIYLRDQGALVYLGYQHLLEQLSEAEFATKITVKLARAARVLEAQ